MTIQTTEREQDRIEPPLPHLTGKAQTDVGKEPRIPLVAPIVTLISSGIPLSIAVYSAPQFQKDWFQTSFYSLLGTSLLLISVVLFRGWLRQRNGDANR